MNSKPTKGLSVDGGCSHNPGKAYYRAVDIATGKEVFREDIGIATNNIAEFLGLCHAIYLVGEDVIYTDSKTAMTWVKNKKVKTSFSSPEIDKRLDKAVAWLKTGVKYNVEKWDTKSFGEIPADFNLKR